MMLPTTGAGVWVRLTILPPGTPKDKVETLEDAMSKIFKDPEFLRYFQKVVVDDALPLGPAELNKGIKEMPRDAEIFLVIRNFSGAGPFPQR